MKGKRFSDSVPFLPIPPLVPRKGSATPRPPKATIEKLSIVAERLPPMPAVALGSSETRSPLSSSTAVDAVGNGARGGSTTVPSMPREPSWPSAALSRTANDPQSLPNIVLPPPPSFGRRAEASGHTAPTSSAFAQEQKYRRVLQRHTRSRSQTHHPIRSKVIDELPAELLNVGDTVMSIRTFDRKEGRVVEHRGVRVPNLERLTNKLYSSLWADRVEVENAEHRVVALSMSEQVRLAALSLKRKKQQALNLSIRRGVVDQQQALERASVELLTEYQEMVSHLGFDTVELSLIRVHNAATDEILHQKAAYLAAVDIARFQSNVLSDQVRPSEILGMMLDAYRHQHVPFLATHKQRSANVLSLPGVDSRRRSSDRGGARTGIHSIVERMQQSMHQ